VKRNLVPVFFAVDGLKRRHRSIVKMQSRISRFIDSDSFAVLLDMHLRTAATGAVIGCIKGGLETNPKNSFGENWMLISTNLLTGTLYGSMAPEMVTYYGTKACIYPGMINALREKNATK